MLLERPFWFLRHGETDWNKLQRTQGSTDIPLNETGIAQAHAAALVLRDAGIARVAASPLSRARVTAEIVAAALGVALEVVPDLREAAFGVHEGEVMGAWFASWPEGGVLPEGGESFEQVQVRAVAALNQVLAGDGMALVVAHGGMFRTLRGAMGLSTSVRTPNGVPLLCTPEAKAWRLQAATEAPLKTGGLGGAARPTQS